MRALSANQRGGASRTVLQNVTAGWLLQGSSAAAAITRPGLRDAPLPLHDSKRHFGPQANSLISKTDYAPDTVAESVPWCRCELISALKLHRGPPDFQP